MLLLPENGEHEDNKGVRISTVINTDSGRPDSDIWPDPPPPEPTVKTHSAHASTESLTPPPPVMTQPDLVTIDPAIHSGVTGSPVTIHKDTSDRHESVPVVSDTVITQDDILESGRDSHLQTTTRPSPPQAEASDDLITDVDEEVFSEPETHDSSIADSSLITPASSDFNISKGNTKGIDVDTSPIETSNLESKDVCSTKEEDVVLEALADCVACDDESQTSCETQDTIRTNPEKTAVPESDWSDRVDPGVTSNTSENITMMKHRRDRKESGPYEEIDDSHLETVVPVYKKDKTYTQPTGRRLSNPEVTDGWMPDVHTIVDEHSVHTDHADPERILLRGSGDSDVFNWNDVTKRDGRSVSGATRSQLVTSFLRHARLSTCSTEDDNEQQLPLQNSVGKGFSKSMDDLDRVGFQAGFRTGFMPGLRSKLGANTDGTFSYTVDDGTASDLIMPSSTAKTMSLSMHDIDSVGISDKKAAKYKNKKKRHNVCRMS